METNGGYHFHGTTILAVRKNGKTVVAGDGQVTLDTHVVKHRARKVRRIYNDRIIAHEMVHAVMGRSINMTAIPTWFLEGTAELIHGADERLAGRDPLAYGHRDLGHDAGHRRARPARVECGVGGGEG